MRCPTLPAATARESLTPTKESVPKAGGCLCCGGIFVGIVDNSFCQNFILIGDFGVQY